MRTRNYSNGVRELAAMANAVNRNFGRIGYPYDYASNGGSNGQTKLSLPVDIWTSDVAYHISAYLPGVDPEGVEITFEGDNLTIRGQFPAVLQDSAHNMNEDVNVESSEEASEETVNENHDATRYIRRELYHGSFERTLSFNVPVNVDEISATFKHGVLTLDVPKAEEILPKQIKVNVA